MRTEVHRYILTQLYSYDGAYLVMVAQISLDGAYLVMTVLI